MKTTLTIALAGTLLLAAIPAQARIKLTTLPERESVRIDIQNGRYTLVEEERTVNLQAGRNQVDFSWANINIDKDSIVFRVIKADGEVNVLNTNYPPNENALYWTVSAANAGPAVIRISYLIANMAAEPSYQGVVENDEKKLLMQVYMTVTNTSGESFGETIVQPGVGKTTVRYFNDGERKRMLAAKFAEVPIAKRYVFDAAVDQEKTRMYYRLTNDKENQMGGFPLPYGKVRLFIKEPKSDGDTVRSQAFLGEDWAQYTPLFAPLDLYVGMAQDVKVERFTMDPEGGVRNGLRRDYRPAVHHRRQGGCHEAAVPQPADPLSLPPAELQDREGRSGDRAADDQGASGRRVDHREGGPEGDSGRAERAEGKGNTLMPTCSTRSGSTSTMRSSRSSCRPRRSTKSTICT